MDIYYSRKREVESTEATTILMCLTDQLFLNTLIWDRGIGIVGA